uniref:Uncharacterized protein n=1 Tax=Anguilla anguilla TaxID=7936 RepID=A0A0E9VIA6_ANGAN
MHTFYFFSFRFCTQHSVWFCTDIFYFVMARQAVSDSSCFCIKTEHYPGV